MGMKKSSALGLLAFAMAMSSTEDSFNITERGNVGTSRDLEPIRKEPTPFNKQEGVLKTITDYKRIQQGLSKIGRLKQNRIVSKIDNWIEKGFLTREDLI